MIRGQKRTLKTEVLPVSKKVKFSIHNRFDVEVIDAATGVIKQRAYAENIVLDALWTRLLTPNTYFGYIHYGTGTGTPAASRTSLFTFLGAKAADTKTLTYDWINGWVSSRKQCQITETENIGSEFKEVGIGYGSASGNLVTHALLKDMNGNTISIIKTNTDIINIYATVFVYWNVNGYDAGGIKLVPLPFNCLLTSYLVGDASSAYFNFVSYWGGSFFSDQFGTDYNESIAGESALTLSYSAANKKITGVASRIATTSGNTDMGIRTVSVDVAGSTRAPAIQFKVGGSWYLKSSIIGESVESGDGTKVDFKTKFPFVKSGAKIYVDGVEQTTGVTIDALMPRNDKMGALFELLDTDFVSGDYNPLMPSPELKASARVDGHTMNYYATYYNPYWSYGIDSFNYSRIKVEVSDNLTDWIILVDTTSGSVSTHTLASENKNKKYWRLTVTGTSGTVSCYNFISSGIASTNIHFAAPPAAGAVITADYDCEVIAKDANHVFDFSFEITLAEKTV